MNVSNVAQGILLPQPRNVKNVLPPVALAQVQTKINASLVPKAIGCSQMVLVQRPALFLFCTVSKLETLRSAKRYVLLGSTRIGMGHVVLLVLRHMLDKLSIII